MTHTADHGRPGRLVDPRLVLRADRHLIRAAGRSRRHLVIDVTAPTVAPDPARRRPPVNLAFVLDRSGSMGGSDKLTLAKEAVIESIHRLNDADRFAVVVYDTRIDVVMPGTQAAPEARREAARCLGPIAPRGSTDLHGGWLTGCEQAAARLSADGVSRVLLLTDGLANVGVTDPDELAAQALQLRQRGVSTSTFGVGTDFDESLLQAMADSGGGHFYYAGDVVQMRDHITSEVGETLEVVARDVVVDLSLPAGVRVDSLSPFRVEHGEGRARIHLGDMVSGQLITIALALVFSFGDLGRELELVARIADRDGVFELAVPALTPVAVAWTYADHPANDAQPRDVEVDRIVARLDAERVKQEAIGLNREGRYDEARRILGEIQVRVREIAGSDTALLAIATELDEDRVTLAAPMPEMARKAAHFRSSTLARMRTADGKSRRA